MRFMILLLLSFTLFSADPPTEKPLPADVQKVVEARDAEVAKAQAVFDAAKAKATTDASKKLEAVVKSRTQKGDLDGALATKAVLEKWAAEEGSKLGDLLGATQAQIVIVKAEYGIDGHYNDCTKFIKEKTENGTKEWALFDSDLITAAGDPAGGAKKGVKVTYAVNGEKKTSVFPYQTSIPKLK